MEHDQYQIYNHEINTCLLQENWRGFFSSRDNILIPICSMAKAMNLTFEQLSSLKSTAFCIGTKKVSSSRDKPLNLSIKLWSSFGTWVVGS